jgi:predicted nuclease of predicted toxin-antitoxin system
MTIALYMDEHVRRAITNGLKLRGIDVITVQEDGRNGTPDSILLERATELNRVIFTQDDDFLVMANCRQQEGVKFSGVIYGHQQYVTVGECVRDLELIAKASESEDLVNQVQYLPL